MYWRVIDPINRAHCRRVLLVVGAFALALILFSPGESALAGWVLLAMSALAGWATARATRAPREDASRHEVRGHPRRC
jgi:hypothetical protein